MDEPDDTTIEALQARVDALKADEATQAGLKNRLDRLEKLSEQVDRVQAQVFVKRTPDAVEPQTAVERLAERAMIDSPANLGQKMVRRRPSLGRTLVCATGTVVSVGVWKVTIVYGLPVRLFPSRYDEIALSANVPVSAKRAARSGASGKVPLAAALL